MNGIDKITERITADVRQEISQIESASKEECRALSEKFEKQAQDAYWKAVSMGKRTADQRVERMQSMAEMESKKQILTLKQELVASAFDLAVDRLTQLPEEAYVDLLADFAVRGAVTGSEQLLFSVGDRNHYGKKVCIAANERLEKAGRKGALTMAEGSRNIRGGVIVTDGQVDINYSLEALMAANRNALMEPVATILFD